MVDPPRRRHLWDATSGGHNGAKPVCVASSIVGMQNCKHKFERTMNASICGLLALCSSPRIGWLAVGTRYPPGLAGASLLCVGARADWQAITMSLCKRKRLTIRRCSSIGRSQPARWPGTAQRNGSMPKHCGACGTGRIHAMQQHLPGLSVPTTCQSISDSTVTRLHRLQMQTPQSWPPYRGTGLVDRQSSQIDGRLQAKPRGRRGRGRRAGRLRRRRRRRRFGAWWRFRAWRGGRGRPDGKSARRRH